MGELMRKLSRRRPRRKVLLLGDTGVGKTSLVHALRHKTMREQYTPTVVSNSLHKFTVDKQGVDLAIWDVGGAAEYAKLRVVSSNQTHLVILCYDVSSRKSLMVAQHQWLEEVKEQCPDAKVVLIGCKADLLERGPRSAERPKDPSARSPDGSGSVSRQELDAAARALQALQTYTLSAASSSQVREAFSELAVLAMHHGRNYRRQRCVLL